MKFFYMDHCGSSVTNPINSDMKSIIYKLVKYLEMTYNVKVQKVCDKNFCYIIIIIFVI